MKPEEVAVLERDLADAKLRVKEIEDKLQATQLVRASSPEFKDKMVGPYNISRFHHVLDLLVAGRTCVFRHESYGEYVVYTHKETGHVKVRKTKPGPNEGIMAIQPPYQQINDQTIFRCMVLSDTGEWFVYPEEDKDEKP
jgi:hypothetical protein